MTEREIEHAIRQFEGLVYTTASQIIEAGVELELDDVRQLLRLKVWHAIRRYDAARDLRLGSLRRFVFGCLFNLRKDIEKRPRRYNTSIEEIRERETQHGETLDQWFDARYLSVDAEIVYAEAEAEELLLPSTLTPIERDVIALRLRGRLLLEIDRELGLSRAQRERVMRSVREKLADWKPDTAAQRTAPMPPLPDAEPRPAPARVALAA